jgi:RND family efflux transporter MFP subunit
MQHQNDESNRKSRLKDYSPAWQSRYSDIPTSPSVPTPVEPLASALPATDHQQGKEQEQEQAGAIGAQAAEPENRFMASSSTLKLPALSMRSRVTAAQNRRLLFIYASLCLVVLLMLSGLVILIRIKSLPASVTVYQVGAQGYAQDIGGGGIVYPLQEEDISYPIAERALAVLVAPGDRVTANQPLIRLDLAQLNAQIDQAKSDVASAQAFLDTVRARGNSVEIAQAEQTYEFAVNKYSALLAEVSSSTLHNGTAISTINGIVTSLYITPGEIFGPNKTMIVIMDESTAIVRAEIPLAYLGQVQPGQTATVTPSSLPGLSFTGKITTIIPQADSQTDTFEIWIAVANPKQLLLPGMSAFVHIQNAGKALGIPRLAVLNADRDDIVFVVRDQRAYIQKVQVVARTITTIFVAAGISAGDQIILVGLDDLQNGQQVRVTNVQA